ncbi:hypothetical protein PGT21_016804 [Puccinia graminis f. sp. tritici]|uniref:Uncharacterized protein n=1 Tax=Puccinia graminis f. sp. tritici TaxID=56615 RepID=A0A5B0MLL8_PUCGR|nr:hypothetical protein PGT21_016804 [Puccinia graminis f. sp. tritici]KAA1126879.1 hypothetical protein PGTUg99_030003 [Puccinia graminis f. sp. tritici]
MVLEMKDWMRMFWLTMGLIVLGVEGGSGGRVVGIPFGCPTEARKMPFCFRRSVAGEDGNIAMVQAKGYTPSYYCAGVQIANQVAEKRACCGTEGGGGRALYPTLAEFKRDCHALDPV